MQMLGNLRQKETYILYFLSPTCSKNMTASLNKFHLGLNPNVFCMVHNTENRPSYYGGLRPVL